jgi:hypothetical protein
MAGRQMLDASVLRLSYSFETTSGILYVEEGTCCDMTACIEFFKKIDPQVTRIATMAGKEPDTSYHLRDGKWEAIPA